MTETWEMRLVSKYPWVLLVAYCFGALLGIPVVILFFKLIGK